MISKRMLSSVLSVACALAWTVVSPASATAQQEPAAGGFGEVVEVELVTAIHEDAVLLPKRALVYDNDYKQFNPTKFDADQWVTSSGSCVRPMATPPVVPAKPSWI